MLLNLPSLMLDLTTQHNYGHFPLISEHGDSCRVLLVTQNDQHGSVHIFNDTSISDQLEWRLTQL
jgi:hypothetical protein